MRERWNHPCVVIWDGQNESLTNETGKAIAAVRTLDRSARPWENGWSEPQSRNDCVESHPYFFIRAWQDQKPFRISDLAGISGVPRLNDRQKAIAVPIIINEYCWLWLNRDGSPTCLTEKVYESLLGPGSSVEQRRRIHARYVAALTEFWRCHRKCAGVLHFCGLGYSRKGDKPRPEGGATSDDWIDLERLHFEPTFEKYVRDAFSPVGLMLDFWAEQVPAGAQREVKVYVVNDQESDWKGDIHVQLMKGKEILSVRAVSGTGEGVRPEIFAIPVMFPAEQGDYILVAALDLGSSSIVHSLRDFKVVRGSKAQ